MCEHFQLSFTEIRFMQVAEIYCSHASLYLNKNLFDKMSSFGVRGFAPDCKEFSLSGVGSKEIFQTMLEVYCNSCTFASKTSKTFEKLLAF